MIEELFKDDIERKKISLEMVREKLNCIPNATPKQVYNKIHPIIGGKSSLISVSADLYLFNIFLYKQLFFRSAK